jgi:hypothetical protein
VPFPSGGGTEIVAYLQYSGVGVASVKEKVGIAGLGAPGDSRFGFALCFAMGRAFDGEDWTNKIFIGIRICTYSVGRDNGGKGLPVFHEVEGGLTGCGMEVRGKIAEAKTGETHICQNRADVGHRRGGGGCGHQANSLAARESVWESPPPKSGAKATDLQAGPTTELHLGIAAAA